MIIVDFVSVCRQSCGVGVGEGMTSVLVTIVVGGEEGHHCYMKGHHNVVTESVSDSSCLGRVSTFSLSRCHVTPTILSICFYNLAL